MTTAIYGLVCPIEGKIRYVGKTTNLKRRFNAHLYSAHNPAENHRERWLANLAEMGLKPSLVLLDFIARGDWEEAERRWIAHGLSQGWPLTNICAGGEGGELLGPEQRAHRKRQMERPEVRERMSESAKARWADPEKRARALQAVQNDERRAALSESAKKRATPEYRAAAAERSRAAWADPLKRAKIVGGITDETRAAVSAAAARMWSNADESKKARMKANLDPVRN